MRLVGQHQKRIPIAKLYWNSLSYHWPHFDLQGSKLYDLTTDRLISARSTDLRPCFDVVTTFATCVQLWWFDNQLKEESQGFQSLIESSNLDAWRSGYGQIESVSLIDSSRRDLSIGCQIVQFGPLSMQIWQFLVFHKFYNTFGQL